MVRMKGLCRSRSAAEVAPLVKATEAKPD